MTKLPSSQNEVAAVLVGILVFKEPASFWRLLFITTLIASVVGLKILS